MSDIPAKWEWSTIGSVTQYIQRGKSPKYAEQSVLPVINQKCIRWNELQLQHLKYIHPDQIDAWDEPRYIKPGDILWNSTGTGTVGRAYLVTSEDTVLPKVVDSHVTIVRAAPDLEPRYLFNWIKSPSVQNKIEEMCDGTTNQIELSRTAIAATAIPIAPRAEQTRIADQLDNLLARVNACNDHLDAIPGILKRFRQAVIRTAMTGGLSDSSAEVLSQEWTTSTIGGVTVDLRYGTSKKCDYDVEGVGVLRIPNITPAGGVSQSDLKFAQFDEQETKKLALKSGDLLVIRSNGSLDLVGRCGMVSEKDEGLLFAGYLMRLRVNTDLVRPAFIMYWLMAADQRKRIELLAKSTSGVNNLNAEELRSLPLRFPTLPEQDEILRKVEAYMACADRIEARYTAMRAHAQRLAPQVLAKAFRGELVEQDPQDEPASGLLQRLAATQSAKAPSSRGRPRAQPQVPATLPAPQAPAPIDWHSLPNNEWAAPAAAQDQAITACLTAVLKAWGQPMPEPEARLATLLCQQPRVFSTVLPAAQARQWVRLVGDEAKPLPAQVARLQPVSNSPWGQAIKRMRVRGDLVEAGSGNDTTWSLGPGASAIITAGWPDGRAAFVVAYLRAHGVASILPTLAPADQAFVHVRAA